MAKPRDPFAALDVPLDLQPMEAKSLAELPAEEGWRYEPKLDGFRCPDFLRLSPGVEDLTQAARWLDASGGETDGVVAKHLDAPYQPGERAMLKVKRLRTADCVVGGFRYATGKPVVGSLLLGLYDAAGR